MPVITFASQKGGVGKTTVLISIATCLHYLHDKSVRVLDSDIPQNSAFKLRDLENTRVKKAIRAYQNGEETPFYLPKILSNPKRSYPIKIIDILDVNDVIGEYKEEYIFIDSLGTMNTEGYDNLFKASDYIILPMSVDYFDFSATLEYVELLKKAKDQNLLKGYFILLNKVNQRAAGDAQEIFELLDQKGIPYFKNFIPLGEPYKREPMTSEKYYRTGVRSTMLPTSNHYINKISEELINKLS